MQSDGPEAIFDRAMVKLRLARQLRRGQYADFLNRHAVQALAQRLDDVTRRFETALVLAPPVPGLVEPIARSKMFGRVIQASPVAGFGADLVMDEEAWPFADASLDCVIVVSGLDAVNDLPGALVQISRALRPDGLFVGSVLGGETLNELRHAWLLAESECAGGVSPRVAPFADLRTLGNLLQRAGFALPVADAERVTVRYDSCLGLTSDLRAMGLSNPLVARSRRPVTRALAARALGLYDEMFRDDDGRVRATFEMFYLTAWGPDESQPKPLKPGSAKHRLADALQVREHVLKDDGSS